MSKAFTLIELLFVIGIITLLTALTLPNYRTGERNLAFQRAAHKLSQDARRVQGMAISAKEFGGAVPPGGYGIYFNTADPTHYILFADADGGKDYDSSEKVEEVEMEKNIEISSLFPDNPLTIIFSPPDPTVEFFPDSSQAVVAIKVAGTETTKKVKINKAGLIFVSDQ